MSAAPVSSVGLRDANGRQNGVSGNPIPITSRLVRQPLGTGDTGYTTVIAGTTPSSVTRTVGAYPNPDGSGVLYLINARGETLTTSGMGAGIRAQAPGSTIGVAFVRGPSSADFDIVIDGVSYAIAGSNSDAGVANAREDQFGCAVFTDLGDGLHDVFIVANGSGVSGTDHQVFVYGLLVEERYGAHTVVPVMGVLTPATVPTSATTPGYNSGLRNEFRGFARIDYYNPTGSSITVTIAIGGVTSTVLTVASGATASWTPAGPINPHNLAITHAASASGAFYTSYGPMQ